MSANPQVVVVATVEVKPGAEDDAIAAIEDTIRRTHDEAGCLAYALHRDRDAPQRFVLIERWTSEVALESHLQQPYVTGLFAKLGDHLAGPPVVQRLAPVPLGDPMKGTL